MKMRKLNELTAIAVVLVNILVFIAILTGPHTVFGIVAASISLATALGAYLRAVVGTAALRVSEKQEKLVRFAIAQQKDPNVVRQFAEWVKTGDLELEGAMITDLAKAMDENGNCEGFWLLMIGSQSAYESIRKKLPATVLDYWPIDPEKWCHNILEALEQDEDFDEDDAIPELKG